MAKFENRAPVALRKGIISLFLLIIVCMCLFPPWNYTYQTRGIRQVKKPAGYSFLFSPPAPERDTSFFGVQIDFARLMIQILIALALATAILFMLPSIQSKRKMEPNPPPSLAPAPLSIAPPTSPPAPDLPPPSDQSNSDIN
jgi:hypothetical protein